MHNKSFTVDKEVTVVGGRNIGDEYFDAGSATRFADLDVMAVGPIASEVSNNFDLYFNSESAHPVESLLGKASTEAIQNLKAAFAAAHGRPGSAQYFEALRDTPFVTELEQGRLAMEWVHAQLVSDDPEKVLHSEPPRDLLMLPRLLRLTGQTRVQFDLISPYFVPAFTGTKDLAQLASQGVRVRVLTNSLGSTDVAVFPFEEVPPEYAWEGGEGDRSVAAWRKMYWEYIEVECKRLGREPSVRAPLLMERFRVVYREALAAHRTD